MQETCFFNNNGVSDPIWSWKKDKKERKEKEKLQCHINNTVFNIQKKKRKKKKKKKKKKHD